MALVVDHHVCTGSPDSPNTAFLVSPPVMAVGGINVPSQVPDRARMVSPLALIIRELYTDPVEITWKPHVEWKTKPENVNHEICTDPVKISKPFR